MRKILIATAIVIVGLPLVAFGVYITALMMNPSANSGSHPLPSCAKQDCGPQLADLRQAILRYDATVSIQKFDYYHSAAFDGTSDTLTVAVTGSQGEKLADTIAELAWKSEISPLDYVYVTVTDASGQVAPLYLKKYDFYTKPYERDGTQHPFINLYGERRTGQLSK